GMVGNAFDFSGNNGYVGVAHHTDFNIDYSWFIDAWIMPLSYPAPGKRGAILMKWVDGGENKALEIGSDGKVFVTLVNVQKQSAQVYSTTNLLMNRFTFVAASYNGTALNLYINGQLDNSLPLSIDVSDSYGTFYMGNHPTRGSEFVPFDGLIDEVEWSKEVPTEQKILELFSSTSKGKCK
ncbi:MAG: LamG domain-containing protein, partial [Nanoarchaeota archaeon]